MFLQINGSGASFWYEVVPSKKVVLQRTLAEALPAGTMWPHRKKIGVVLPRGGRLNESPPDWHVALVLI